MRGVRRVEGRAARADPVAALGGAVARLEAITGHKVTPEQLLIDPGERFVDWCERLGREGMKVDGKPFNLADRPALRPLYEAIPTTREEARNRIVVVMKATQLGMTVWEVLANIYMAAKWEPVTIGMFLPDRDSATYKSEHRFMRIVRSIPRIYERLTKRVLVAGGEEEKVGEGNVLTRPFGESILLFLWTSGKVTTEGRPMDVTTLDEVQEMALVEIDKVHARMGDSEVAFSLLLSTANMPELDIDFWYRQGDQRVWHSRCRACGLLSDLSDPAGIFPAKSIVYNTGDYPDAALNEYHWACPSCRAIIEDPQDGELVVTNPGASTLITSYLMPRTISPRMTPRMAAERWARAKTGDQKKSLYNRMLARPYIDADHLPVTMAHCVAAAEKGVLAGLKWETSGRGCVMGIDQMGGFNAVIIKRRLPNGQQAVVHVEAVFNNDPFARCSELMELYGVEVCVVEQLPNVNDARRFANDPKHQGRVFLAGYANLRDDAMVWGDAISLTDKKTVDEERTRYTVTLQQYKCMQTALYRVRDAFCLFPDPSLLEQDVLENGVRKRIHILRDWVFLHLTKTAIVVEEANENERKLKSKVLKVGLDPHFAFAMMLCDVAWARSWGNSSFILPDAAPSSEQQRAAAAEKNLPGLPAHVMAMIQDAAVRSGTCGSCFAYPREGLATPTHGLCSQRNINTAATDPGCPFHVPRS